ncbi:type 2 lanthipeptide synthetase LanM family protein [Actinomadura chokoriensis]|uniref:Type 2 lanthipeptide synthetase LanM family protein n=1 Tax=Actinomadura chokoriensis TaxID=454156 RepID=A0ABV4QYZ5_9ACTN
MSATAAAPSAASDDLQDAGLGLLEIARPQIAAARRALRAELSSRPGLPGGLTGLLVREPPPGRLAMAVQPALARELDAARRRGLDGATPRERYEAFVRSLREPETARRIWAAHPVLAGLVPGMLDDWVAARAAFARDLAADLPALTETFGGLGALGDVVFGSAETHRGGRTVAIVRFERGTVVYKPRSLAVDGCFDRLLGWFNASEGVPHPLRRPRLLDRGDRGWSEYIEPAPCTGERLPAFFWRMGALLALTHAVHGYDLHADNVIAAGADPVVIDLEALFHTEGTQPAARRARLGDPAAERLAASVLRTGLLPGPLVMPDADTELPFGIDISPLGIAPARRSLIPTPMTEDPGTDRMRVGLGYRTVPAPAGRLRLPGGEAADPRAHRGALTAGYTFAYRRLAAAGTTLLAPAGPLHGCADVPVRLIQLSTFLYVRLLLEGWRPEAVRDPAAHERGLDRLAAGWPGVPHRAALVDAEKAALRRGEVPVFEVRPGHRDVWLEDGTRLPDVLPVPPIEETAARLAALGEDDLAGQLQIIDASLAALDTRPRAGHPAHRPSGDDPVRDALDIARRLDATAVRDGDRIGWLTVEVVDAASRRVAPAGLDLYGGLPGIGLFLSYLSAVTGERWAARLAEQVADEVALRCRASAAVPALGPVYHLAHAAAVHRRADLAEAASGAPPPAPAGPGVLDGEAGALLSALALHAVLPGAGQDGGQAEEAARAAGERLLAMEPAGDGFGYGAPGAAVAHARLHGLLGDPRHAARARELAARGPATGPGRCPTEPGWCQGAAGTGLALLVLRGAVPGLERSLDAAARTVRDAGPQPDDSLCHGASGLAELLTALGEPAPRPSGVWRAALPAPAPGLLAGLSGIGFGLLRRAFPADVPAVLALAPPNP